MVWSFNSRIYFTCINCLFINNHSLAKYLDINIYSENEGEGVIFVEHWEDQSKYEKYLAWRTESGVMDKLAAMLDAPPIIRFAADTSL